MVKNKGVNKAFQLSSPDNWGTAEIKAATAAEDRFQYPTTATLEHSNLWLMNSKINELSDPSVTPSKIFSIQLVNFQPVR